MNLSLESVLIKGTFHGVQKGLNVIDIEKVYNPLPDTGICVSQNSAENNNGFCVN